MFTKTIRLAALTLLAIFTANATQAAPKAPIEVRVVIVTTWEDTANGKDVSGEQHAWRTQWPMTQVLPFPVGASPLLYDPKRHVLTY